MKKIKSKLFNCLISAAAICLITMTSSCGKADKGFKDTRLSIEDGKTVVERYGTLQVIGTDVCDQYGNPVQIRGMSSHGLQWYGKYANKDVITWLRDDFNCQIWRAALYTSAGGYIGNPALKQKMIDSIEACKDAGIYVLIDWHVMDEHDPMLYKAQALEFFDEMSKTYGHLPNVIYELCNEPNTDKVTWKGNIKPYAEEVIEVIRKNDPDNIIIVGTPRWSSKVLDAANDPILNQKNIMYTFHFYAGSHGQDYKDELIAAHNKGLPIFCTEWGCTQANGDGGVFEKESLEWLELLKENNISWINWSVTNKGEDSGILKFNADREAKGHWTDKELSKAGVFVRSILRNELDLKTWKKKKNIRNFITRGKSHYESIYHNF